MLTAANKYLQTQVTTTNQGELLVMLYEGAIRFLTQAKVMMEAKDYAQKGILISKALDVINELSSSLNKERGGAVADNLSNLYFYCNSRLLIANLKMDAQILDEVIRILTGLRDAFAQIVRDSGGTVAVAPAPEDGSPVPPGLTVLSKETPEALAAAHAQAEAEAQSEVQAATASAAMSAAREDAVLVGADAALPDAQPAPAVIDPLRRRVLSAYAQPPK